jgi:hypothetical protein
MFHPEQINWLAVILGAVALMVIGFVWYGPLFGRLWMEASGRRPDPSGAGPVYALSGLGALVMSAAFALLLTTVPAADRTIVTGVIWGAILGVGFIATTSVTHGIFEAHKAAVVAIFSGYEIVGLIVIGIILTALK